MRTGTLIVLVTYLLDVSEGGVLTPLTTPCVRPCIMHAIVDICNLYRKKLGHMLQQHTYNSVVVITLRLSILHLH